MTTKKKPVSKQITLTYFINEFKYIIQKGRTTPSEDIKTENKKLRELLEEISTYGASFSKNENGNYVPEYRGISAVRKFYTEYYKNRMVTAILAEWPTIDSRLFQKFEQFISKYIIAQKAKSIALLYFMNYGNKIRNPNTEKEKAMRYTLGALLAQLGYKGRKNIQQHKSYSSFEKEYQLDKIVKAM